ncbi:hypothetical protein A4S06_09350 [Erysipelotrichaceae bacterium MTC7]|nr:hypothetical protein A4S06_09350 [Erysipelotrichaceae bacterium MTC7]
MKYSQKRKGVRLFVATALVFAFLSGFSYPQTNVRNTVVSAAAEVSVASYEELKNAVASGAQNIAITSNDMFYNPIQETITIDHDVSIRNASDALNLTLKAVPGKRHFYVTKNGSLHLLGTSDRTIVLTGDANVADPSSYSGGINVSGGSLELNNVTFNQTVAKLGGAIEAYDNAKLQLDTVSFRKTKATTPTYGGHGSAIYYDNSKSYSDLAAGSYNIQIANSTVDTTTATFNGAFFFKDVTARLENMRVSNIATSGNGGVFYIDNSDLNRSGVTTPQIRIKEINIENSNSSLSGGDFHVINTSMDIDGLQTSDAHASGSGGSIYAKLSDVSISNSKFIDNKSTHLAPAIGFKGGAMMIVDSNFTIHDSKLESALTSGDISASTENATYGGGIYITGNTVFKATGLSIDGGQAEFGGAMYIDSATSVTIDGSSSFTNNTATTNYSKTSAENKGDGGAIYVNPEVEIDGEVYNMYTRMHIAGDTTFANNIADIKFTPNNAIEKYREYIPLEVAGVSPDQSGVTEAYQKSPLNSWDINFDEEETITTKTIIVKYHGRNPAVLEATKSQVFTYTVTNSEEEVLPTVPILTIKEVGFEFPGSDFVKFVYRVDNDPSKPGVDVTKTLNLNTLPEGVILQEISGAKVLHIDAVWKDVPVVSNHTLTIAEVTDSSNPTLTDHSYNIQVYLKDETGNPVTGYVTLANGQVVIADANGMITFTLKPSDEPIVITSIPENYQVKVVQVPSDGFKTSYTADTGSGEHDYDTSFVTITSDSVVEIMNTVETNQVEPNVPNPDPGETPGTVTPEVPQTPKTPDDDAVDPGTGPITGFVHNDPMNLLILIMVSAAIVGSYELMKKTKHHK